MNPPRFRIGTWGVATLAITVAIAGVCYKDATCGSTNGAVDERRERGKYLVHHVAQCIQCHTPRDPRGALDEGRLLMGAAIPVAGPQGSAPWAAESVALAGLGNYDEPFVRYLLTRGARPDGTRPKDPMPAFRLNSDDADAVIAYLKSIR